MNKNTLLVVPSRERANWLKGRQNNTLKQVAHLNPLLYVREDDSQMDAYKQMADEYGVGMLMQDPSALGAAQTYDSLIDLAIRDGYQCLVVLDDDLSFSMHNPIKAAKPDYKRCTPDELAHLVDDFANLTSLQLPAASMTPIMKRSQPGCIGYAHPLMWTYSFYLPHFKAHPEHRYWKGKHIEARCDLNLALTLLTQGYLTAFMATCFIPDNVNNPGGCSTYRTLDLEKQSVDYLKATYPGLVTTHYMRGWVGDANVQREAPIIKWKRAFNHEAFAERFGEEPIDFTRRHLTDYETRYGAWVDEIRSKKK